MRLLWLRQQRTVMSIPLTPAATRAAHRCANPLVRLPPPACIAYAHKLCACTLHSTTQISKARHVPSEAAVSLAQQPSSGTLMGNLLATGVIQHLRRLASRVCCIADSVWGVSSAVTAEGNPVPVPIHISVPAAQLKPGRLILIGDIHGCCQELEQLLEACKFDPQTDNLVLLGDIVNKGPHSPQVLALARQWQPWVVRGNHDDAALHAYYLRQRGDPDWDKPSWGWVADITAADAELLAQLPFSISFPDYGVLAVHAGLIPGQPVQQQLLSHLYKMRDVLQEPRGRWVALEDPVEGSQPWGALWPGPLHVFYGHDARRKLQLYPYATGLDTGCVYGGQLTAAVLPSLEQLQQDNVFASKVAAQQPLTLQDLQGRLVSVNRNPLLAVDAES